MLRRTLLLASLAAPMEALAQTTPPAGPQTPPAPEPFITPENDLERAFIAAVENESLRPAFRRLLLTSQVAVVMASPAANAGPRLTPLRGEERAGLIFTSMARLRRVAGPTAPARQMTGREALTLLRGNHVALNARLLPMLTLEPTDVASYLADAPATPQPDIPVPIRPRTPSGGQ